MRWLVEVMQQRGMSYTGTNTGCGRSHGFIWVRSPRDLPDPIVVHKSILASNLWATIFPSPSVSAESSGDGAAGYIGWSHPTIGTTDHPHRVFIFIIIF